MWQLKNPITRRAELDFSASEQSRVTVTQLGDDRVQLINAVEYVNWGKARLQFLVCEDCGYVGCAREGWVELKRADPLALIMPAFTSIGEASEIIHSEYLPPYYFVERGAIYVEQETYTKTLCQIAAFPRLETLAPLSAWEAAKLFQLEAPSHVLGHLSTPPQFNQALVIASAEGNFREQTKVLTALINRLLTQLRPAKLQRVTEQDQIISLSLDLAGFPEWQALSYNGSRYALYLEPGYVIE
ncbi:hypothetical protein H6F76_23390 [Leptolyngbya sp. FACHB-321]|uniref:hypothetical protein n=1 Tax=Leptolyngbya sp. FACHB-321 TaxID=2692807 RepID=UPI001689DCBF|nr:hypothetical protein [Leptolyngbya sp. FACHB-321]MBD2037901.1 hypothetical protein [Leptolyngbya sp. FACHB-321]